MGAFETSRLIPVVVPDLAPVANDVVTNFQVQGYEATAQQPLSGGWLISLRKGNAFKAILGMNLALNLEFSTMGNGTAAKAKVGVVGLQAIPTAISMLIFWPVALTQAWGMVQQSQLDEQALAVLEASLRAHAASAASAPATLTAGTPVAAVANTAVPAPPATGVTATPSAQPAAAEQAPAPVARFCTQCGGPLQPSARFCPQCGTKVEA